MFEGMFEVPKMRMFYVREFITDSGLVVRQSVIGIGVMLWEVVGRVPNPGEYMRDNPGLDGWVKVDETFTEKIIEAIEMDEQEGGKDGTLSQ